MKIILKQSCIYLLIFDKKYSVLAAARHNKKAVSPNSLTAQQNISNTRGRFYIAYFALNQVVFL